MNPTYLFPLTILLLGNARPTLGANVKLWELGTNVEENPITVFAMFAFVVALTVLVETLKHYIEHKTVDPYRLAGLEAIYIELMLVGVVSFFLILGAELGLTSIRIGSCSSTPSTPSDNTPSAGSSSSGSALCGYGFDLDLFEYAHLALFFMGIAYCIYLQLCFAWRDRFGKTIKEHQKFTLASWKYLEDRTGKAKCVEARKVLLLRSAFIMQNANKIKYVCTKSAYKDEVKLAEMCGEPTPKKFPPMSEATDHFDMGKYIKLLYSELMIELIHVPIWVWGCVIAMATMNLVHMLDIKLAITMMVSAGFGPILSILLWWRLEVKLSKLVSLLDVHPDLYTLKFHGSNVHEEVLKVNPDFGKNIEPTKKLSPWTPTTPWDEIKGDGSLSSPSATSFRKIIQVVTFSTCFYVGQLVMLTPLISKDLGPATLLLGWMLPVLPLGYLVPRSMLTYTLVFLTANPSLINLTKTLREGSPHNVGHSHGHGGHGHGDDHGHSHGGHGHGHGHHDADKASHDNGDEKEMTLLEHDHHAHRHDDASSVSPSQVSYDHVNVRKSSKSIGGKSAKSYKRQLYPEPLSLQNESWGEENGFEPMLIPMEEVEEITVSSLPTQSRGRGRRLRKLNDAKSTSDSASAIMRAETHSDNSFENESRAPSHYGGMSAASPASEHDGSFPPRSEAGSFHKYNRRKMQTIGPADPSRNPIRSGRRASHPF
eukprot:TRINITY_DN11277_c0_g1_i1.p1 TRINITY_DN11277_c0_g1~~TRINITY_DN11277_c0_g1_i1.p1  ORF type:complete len:710 (+),score=60.87 TRINITY_DN11277_c0_g1_i1:76-2205(+)